MYYKNRFTPVLFHFMYLRDTYFTGNEDLYYGPEMVATMIASAGTATFRSFNMGSEINMAEKAGYGKGGASTNPSAHINGNSYDMMLGSKVPIVP